MAVVKSTRNYSTIRSCRFCGAPFAAKGSNQHCSYQCRFKEIAAPFSGIDACWEWPKSRNVQTGYGQFMATVDGERKLFTAPRASFEIFKGPIPEGLCACHKCDNHGCFNPDHLFAGTQKENVQDMIDKGRSKLGTRPPGWVHPSITKPERLQRGGGHHAAKIDDKTARLIKDAAGSMASISRKFGVPYGIVTSIKYGTAWRHI